jgi:hypothetical protein
MKRIEVEAVTCADTALALAEDAEKLALFARQHAILCRLRRAAGGTRHERARGGHDWDVARLACPEVLSIEAAATAARDALAAAEAARVARAAVIAANQEAR